MLKKAKKGHIGTRITAWLLTCVMVLSLVGVMPDSVWAESGDVTWVDGTTVDTPTAGTHYYFDLSTLFANDNASKITAGTYGLMTVDHGSSNAMGYHSAQYGVQAKLGNTFTFQVPGDCYIVVSGDNNSGSAATITATSATGTFAEATLATKTDGHCDLAGVKEQSENAVSFAYTGSAGTATLTLNGSTAYICAMAIIPMPDQDPDGDGWVDGTEVKATKAGLSYYFDLSTLFANDNASKITAGTYGLMAVDHGPSNAMGYHSAQYGVQAKLGNTFTLQVPGDCYIVVSGDNNSGSAATITATSETGSFAEATLATKTDGHCDLAGVKAQNENAVTFAYSGSAGKVTLTLNGSTAYICAMAIIPMPDQDPDGDGWADGTEVKATQKGLSYYFDLSTLFANDNASKITAGTYGLMTVDHGSSNAMGYHSAQYGVQAKLGNTFTLQVPGNCYIVVSGDNNSGSAATITATSETGSFAEATLATKTDGHCDLAGVKAQNENAVTFAYSGSAGKVTLTLNGSTAYICAMAIIPMEDQDPDGDGWVDGTTVSNVIKGNSYYFDMATTSNYVAEGTYGLMTVNHGQKNAMTYHGTTYGVSGKEGNNFTFKVPGNCYIVVSGDNNSAASATITATSENGEFKEDTLATQTSGHCDLNGVKTQGANSVSFLYVGTAGTVTLTINGSTAYICAMAIIPAADDIVLEDPEYATVSGNVDSALNGEVLVFSDGENTTTATIANGAYTVTLQTGATYTVSFEKGIYKVTSTATIDLTEAVDGDTKTLDITYEKLNNRLVLDAAATLWELRDAAFGAYKKTSNDWYSGDGLIISGTIAFKDTTHGATTSKNSVYSINVPAGQTTITFGVCSYGSGTATITCGDKSQEVVLHGDGTGGSNDKLETSVIFTNDSDATITITMNTNGFLHYIKAKTETVQPSATVSGTVDSAVNGEVLNFMVNGATVATATIENGAYTVDLPIGSEYTIAFDNAAVYEMVTGTSVDLTNASQGDTFSNNITYVKWDANKEFTLTIGDTEFTVTPGASKAEDYTVVVNSGSGSVELVTPNTAIVWTDLEGLGGGVLASNKITNVSSNVTTSFSGNTITVTYVDKSSNPTSYQIVVKDNSATGEAVADGTPILYDFTNGSVVSTLYNGSKYLLKDGKTLKSVDGLVTLTGNKKIFYNGAQHGIAINQNDTISVNVAGDATITFVTCLYTNGQTTSELTATCGSAGTITPASQNFTSVSADGEVITFEYTGEATTLVFTFTSSGSAYVHSMTVKNEVAASDVKEEQDKMPEIVDQGTSDSLEAIPAGQRYIFTQTGGQMNTDVAKGAINSSVSYFGFPETTGKYKLEADVVLSSCGASNYNGIYFGAFDENYIATVAIRNSTGLRGILSKSSADMAGASTIDASITSGQKVHYVVERTDDCFVISVTPEDGETYTIEFDYKDSGVLLFKELGVDTPVSYGFAIAGASAIVTNMKYTDENGKVLYDQNACYEPVGTAPIVSGASAEADSTREFISVNWTSSVAVVGDGRYVVQVSKDGSEYVTIEETTATAFDYGITEAGKYTFRVAGKLGENGEVNTWVYSEELTVIAALTKPVVNISATASKISLSWAAVNKAISYEVYRYSYDEGVANATKIATVTTPSYVDTKIEAEVPYYYYVVAISEDNYSNPSITVWAVPTAGHTGDYVYENEATEIFITKKSYDTVFANKVVLEGNVYGKGKMNAVVNGTIVASKELNSGDKFSFTLTVEEGRNDVNLLFTDEDGKITRKTFNFVYLTHYDMVVDDDYTGTDGDTSEYGVPAYKTVQAAVNAVPSNNSDSKVILVMAGDYEERLEVSSPYITIIGEDRENTLIHCYPADILKDSNAEAGGDMALRCATIIKNTATGFSAENISFANDYVYSTPDNKSNKSADAIRVEADQSSFVNVKFSGVQDTLYMHSGMQYYYKCVIEGLVDFIYSGYDARAYFNDCDIVFVFESTKSSGYVCAPRTDEDATYGLTFNNCRILREEGCNGTGYLLARPWGADAYITWINCYMGSVINEYEPYNDMSGNSYKEARFFEFGTYGPGFQINADRRQISPTQAAAMISAKYLGWDPEAVVAGISADHYVGSVSTDKEEEFETAERENDKHDWTEGDDSGLKMFDQEGYAEAYGVTGGGLLLETSKNYYKVATGEEFLKALMAIKASGKASVIELTADIALGCYEIKDFASYSGVIKAYGAQALTHPTLIKSGVSQVTLDNIYNVTIFSQNGASIKHANITMKNSENIIIRNIKFDELWEWDEETEGNYDRNDWDFITIDSNCDGIWIDHCTFYKAYDGVIDVKNPGYITNVTISWCEFLPGSEDNIFFDAMMDEIKANPDKYPYYQSLLKDGLTKDQAYKYAYFQKKTHLFGQDDSYTNAVGIRVTLANNYYKNTMDRMPRLRYGYTHVYNCVMDSKDILAIRLALGDSPLRSKFVSNGASSTCGAQMLLENCYIRDIQDALNSGNGNSPSGYINAINSLYYMNGKLTTLEPKAKSHTDDRVLITDADAFIEGLPYSDYVLYDAEDLRGIIPVYAGAGKLELTTLQWEKTSYNAEYEAPEVIDPKGEVVDASIIFMITLLGAAFVTAGFFAKKKFATEE